MLLTLETRPVDPEMVTERYPLLSTVSAPTVVSYVFRFRIKEEYLWQMRKKLKRVEEEEEIRVALSRTCNYKIGLES